MRVTKSINKEILILLLVPIMVLLLQSCSKKNKNEWDYTIAPKDYEVNGQIDNSQSEENVATPKYNSSNELNYLANIDLEKDFEKYYKKYSLYEKNLEYQQKLSNSEKYKYAKDFIINGNRIDLAYKTILFFYKQRENLNYVDFNLYCNPYTGNLENQKYEDECAAIYNEATELYRLTNLALLKARRMILDIVNTQMKENAKIEEKEMAYTMIILSYLAQDRLYRYDEIVKYAKVLTDLSKSNKENDGKLVVKIFFDDDENERIEKLINFINSKENLNLVEVINYAKKEKIEEIIFSTNGYYNYLNDNYYTPVGVVKRGDKYSINAYFPQYVKFRIIPEIMKKLMPGNLNDEKENKYYDYQNNLDNLYDNEHVIFPFNNILYFIEYENKNIKTVKLFNPKLFDLNYPNMNSNIPELSGMPRIMNEYNYKINNSEFISFEDGKAKVLWNNVDEGYVVNENDLFKLGNNINCFSPIDSDTSKICGNRELLIITKYNEEYANKYKVKAISIEDDQENEN